MIFTIVENRTLKVSYFGTLDETATLRSTFFPLAATARRRKWERTLAVVALPPSRYRSRGNSPVASRNPGKVLRSKRNEGNWKGVARFAVSVFRTTARWLVPRGTHSFLPQRAERGQHEVTLVLQRERLSASRAIELRTG